MTERTQTQPDEGTAGPAAWLVAGLLLAVCVLAYGFWIPRLGLYWDDWWLIWAAETGGAARVLEGLIGERLLHGWMYVLTTAIYQVSPEALHVLVLATRWTAALAAWWTVRAIWPARGLEALGVGLLMAVYPGFSQQSLALIYSDYFLTLTFFLVSLGGMLWALRRPRRFWWLFALSLLAAIPAHWVIEYWLGLELLRLPLALWVAAELRPLRESWKPGAVRAVAVTAPFYANVAVKVVAAMLVESGERGAETLGGHMAAIAANPSKELLNRVGYVISDIGDAVIFAWTRALQPGMPEMRLRYTILAVVMALAAAGLTAVLMTRVAEAEERDPRGGDPRPPQAAGSVRGERWATGSHGWPWVAMGVGLLAILVGQLPMWITDRQIEWGVAALDRHTLPAMFGAGIFVVGLWRLLLTGTRAFTLGMAILVAAGAWFQFRQGHEYWREHEQQASFLWQWHWRVPGLEPGTSVFLHHEPISLPQSKDYTYAVPLNLVYDPGYDAGPVKYWVFPDAPGFPPYWMLLLSGGHPDLVRQAQGLMLAGSGAGGEAELERYVRNLIFAGSTDRSLVAVHRPPGCLRVLDPDRDELTDIPPAVREARGSSRPELILAEGVQDVDILRRYYGPEPAHGWCYFYQRAELARQLGAWPRVAELADEARERGLGPSDDREWTPFIEGYVRAGRADEARRLAQEVVPYGGSIWDLHGRHARHSAFCDLERRLSSDGALTGAAADVFDLGDARVLTCPAVGPHEAAW